MDHSKTDIDRLIPTLEAFRLLGIKTTKGYDEVKTGRLRLVRNGRRTFIRASVVNAYIAALSGEARHIDASQCELQCADQQSAIGRKAGP